MKFTITYGQEAGETPKRVTLEGDYSYVEPDGTLHIHKGALNVASFQRFNWVACVAVDA